LPLIKLIVAFMLSIQMGCRFCDPQIYHRRKRANCAVDHS
jgi:hypothetical protein